MSADVPRISGAEWQVMHVIWDEHPVSAAEVARRIGPERGWSLHTVKTLLARLTRKGVLSFEVQGKRYLYRPKLDRDTCVAAESESFLDRVFHGSPSPLLAHFLRKKRLSSQDIAELKSMLAEMEDDEP